MEEIRVRFGGKIGSGNNNKNGWLRLDKGEEKAGPCFHFQGKGGGMKFLYEARRSPQIFNLNCNHLLPLLRLRGTLASTGYIWRQPRLLFTRRFSFSFQANDKQAVYPVNVSLTSTSFAEPALFLRETVLYYNGGRRPCWLDGWIKLLNLRNERLKYFEKNHPRMNSKFIS